MKNSVPQNVFPIEIIDFTDEFFRQKGKMVPPERNGKFVVMRDEAKEARYLVLSPVEQSVYHAQIVDQFCRLERFSVDGIYLKKNQYFVIKDVDWSVEGGGRWKYNETHKELRLYDSSQAYGACALKDLKKCLAKVSATAGWRIVIE